MSASKSALYTWPSGHYYWNQLLVAIKEYTDQNILHVAYRVGSFHVIFDTLFLPLMQWSISLIKNFIWSMEIVMSSDVQLSMLFDLKDALWVLDRYRLESHNLGPPLISAVVVDNYRQPDTSRFQQAPGSAFLPQGFLHSPGNPSEFRGLMLLGAGISWAVFQFSEGQFSGSFCIVQLGLTTVKTASYCISSFPVSLSAPPYCCFLPNNLSALTSLFRSASR